MSADPLPPTWFRRADKSADEAFYSQPRFVTHIDEGAIAAVTQLYREYLPVGGVILDLMSSWISHLPTERPFRRVVGLGMNAAELAANERLSSFVVQNLNHRRPRWQIVGQHPPRTARAHEPAQRVEEFTQRVRALRGVLFHQGQVWDHKVPLLISNIARIRFAAHGHPAYTQPPPKLTTGSKQRFLEALDVIYNPPDPKMAKSYVLGHVKGDDARERMRGQLALAVGGLSADLKRQAREYRDASSKLLEANDKLRLAKDKPSAFRELLAKLDQLNPEIQTAERRLGELNSQIESSKTEIDRRNKRLGEVREELKELGPDQLRVAIADRAKRAYEG